MFLAVKKFFGWKPEPDAAARTFFRCFSSADGKAVLEHLHHHTLFRITDPNASGETIRFLEGQRQLVLYMCQMIAKGKQTPPNSNGDPQ